MEQNARRASFSLLLHDTYLSLPERHLPGRRRNLQRDQSSGKFNECDQVKDKFYFMLHRFMFCCIICLIVFWWPTSTWVWVGMTLKSVGWALISHNFRMLQKCTRKLSICVVVVGQMLQTEKQQCKRKKTTYNKCVFFFCCGLFSSYGQQVKMSVSPTFYHRLISCWSAQLKASHAMMSFLSEQPNIVQHICWRDNKNTSTFL